MNEIKKYTTKLFEDIKHIDEFGTLNNLSADYSTIKELEESFVENGISNINFNDPFKGGAITKGMMMLMLFK